MYEPYLTWGGAVGVLPYKNEALGPCLFNHFLGHPLEKKFVSICTECHY